MATEIQPRIKLGRIILSPTAKARLSTRDVWTALQRHVQHKGRDFGVEDWGEDENPPTEGFNVVSLQYAADGSMFWVDTMFDRSQTNIYMDRED